MKKADIYAEKQMIRHLTMWQQTELKRIARNAYIAGYKNGKAKQKK